MIQGLLFDLDGTLIDSTQDLADAGNHVRRLRGMQALSLAQVAGYIGDGVEALVARLLETDEGPVVAAYVAHFKAYYHDHCLDSTRAYEAVAATLKGLAGRGYRMAVVTNKPSRISSRILDGLGLGGLFKAVIGGDSAAHKKPHAAPLLMACKELKLEAARCAMVGDSRVDVEAARNAGLKALGILGGIGDQELLKAAGPDVLLPSFEQLLDHLPVLEA